MNAFALFLVLAVEVTMARSMPVSDPGLQDISTTASLACTADVFSEDNQESDLFSLLHDNMMETIDAINTTLGLTSQWVSVLGNSKGDYCAQHNATIIIPVIAHAGLSDVQNIRMRSLLQMSSYAHFLRSQENNTRDYEATSEQLHNTLNHVTKVAVVLGQLLPGLTCQTIRMYVEEDVRGYVIEAPPNGSPSSAKRSFCYCVLESMLHDCQATLIRVQTGTITA